MLIILTLLYGLTLDSKEKKINTETIVIEEYYNLILGDVKMYNFFINVAVIAIILIPFAIILLIIGLIKRNKKIKRWSNFSFVSIGILFCISILGAMVFPEKQGKVAQSPKAVVSEKKETKPEHKKEYNTKEIETDTSKSSEVNTEESSSNSSEEAFDPNKFQVVDYNEWNHDKVTPGTSVQITGNVIQIQKSSEEVHLRVALDDMSDQVVLVAVSTDDYKEVIAEDDNVTIYGINLGLTSYTTVMGNEITIPSMMATRYTVNSYGQ
ncbi:hypothetical protein ACMZ62_07155 [Streptococcus pluranimalium]